MMVAAADIGESVIHLYGPLVRAWRRIEAWFGFFSLSQAFSLELGFRGD